MIYDNGKKQIELKMEQGKTLVETWLEYARQSEDEYESIMLGNDVQLWTQKSGDCFIVELQVRNKVFGFGECFCSLTGLSNKEISDKCVEMYNKLMKECKGNIDKFINKYME